MRVGFADLGLGDHFFDQRRLSREPSATATETSFSSRANSAEVITSGYYGDRANSHMAQYPPQVGLLRSQSAAPSFRSTIGPPPGMKNRSSSVAPAPPPGTPAMTMSSASNYSYESDVGFSLQRPSSTPGGLYGEGDSAIRPHAKTLMDLIHEGGGPEQPSIDHGRRSASPVLVTHGQERNIPHGQGNGGLYGGDVHFQHPGEIRSSSRGTPVASSVLVHQVGQSMPQEHNTHVYLHEGQYLDGQAVFYHDHHANGRLQAHAIDTGRPMFVNGPAPSGSGQALYASAVSYHPHHSSQSQMIQQALSGSSASGDPYLSVVSIPQQRNSVAYWQSDPMAKGSLVMNGAQPHSPTNQHGNMHHANDGRSGGLQSCRSHGRDRGGRGRRGGQGGGRRGGDHKMAMSSPLLEEFRASKNRDWSIFQIEGHVVEFCQDQNGSRFIQQRLEMRDPGEQQLVMREVLPAIRRLRNDVFGNYVVQKLLDFGSQQVRTEIRDTLEGEMLQLSLQMYGCRVVQKSLETLSEEDLPRLLTEFHHNVLSCIHDQNGNHVIQKCIEVLSQRAATARLAGDKERAAFMADQIGFIVKDVLVNAATLSCHPYGCRVLQRILEHCQTREKEAILDEILRWHRKLLDDQYGNYVIQHVLQFGRDKDRYSVLGIVVENGLLGLSRQKFASNVVEKLLKYGNADHRLAIVREMLKVRLPSNARDTRIYSHAFLSTHTTQRFPASQQDQVLSSLWYGTHTRTMSSRPH